MRGGSPWGIHRWLSIFKCPLRWRRFAEYDEGQTTRAQLLGIAYHAAMERWAIDGDGPGVEYAVGQVCQDPDDVTEVMRTYSFRIAEERHPTWKYLGTEVDLVAGIEAKALLGIDEDMPLTGRTDGVIELTEPLVLGIDPTIPAYILDPGTRLLLDYKRTSREGSTAWYAGSWQFALYTTLYNANRPEAEHVSGTIIDICKATKVPVLTQVYAPLPTAEILRPLGRALRAAHDASRTEPSACCPDTYYCSSCPGHLSSYCPIWAR